MSVAEKISFIAVLTAKTEKIAALKSALSVLVHPTREEPACLDYNLFQLRDTPSVFYVCESWQDQAGLDRHVTLPHFQQFSLQLNELLAEPLRFIYLQPLEVQ